MRYTHRLACCAIALCGIRYFLDSALAASPSDELDKQYVTLLVHRIDSQWRAALERYKDQVQPGIIHVHFLATSDRHIRDISVTPGKADDLLTKFTVAALGQVDVPSFPRSHPAGEPFKITVNFEIK